MNGLCLTNAQARRFLLRKHGLLGEPVFAGKAGVLDFVQRVGCVQFDPVDVCGKNAELVLQSRVAGFDKPMLGALLYEDRALVDYFDKNLSIFATCDWPYFARRRAHHRARERSHVEILTVADDIKRHIAAHGAVCSADLDLPDKVNWYWSETRLSRAALEHLYFAGELGIHHKRGGIKYYDLIERCLPAELAQASDPFPDDGDHLAWRVLRRIGAVGLLWNRASDAWLGIDGLNAASRAASFDTLLAQGHIAPVTVEGVREPLYVRAEDLPLAARCAAGEEFSPRCELIAPLDNLLWDRKLIRALFGFDYKWEIYTPVEQRKYGHYVLPLLWGDRFAARVESAVDRRRGVLTVKNIWHEEGCHVPSDALNNCFARFAAFNDCGTVTMSGTM